jgi:hypothetical protein
MYWIAGGLPLRRAQLSSVLRLPRRCAGLGDHVARLLIELSQRYPPLVIGGQTCFQNCFGDRTNERFQHGGEDDDTNPDGKTCDDIAAFEKVFEQRHDPFLLLS